jgi:lipopolysaccharide transport system permease protein
LQNSQLSQWKIDSGSSWFRWNLNELWQYRDLLKSFVRRDFIANYQQTVLGPLWIFLQPALTTLVYWIIFSRIAKVSTDNVPPILFYLPGIIVWNYFSDCLNGTMYTFIQNSTLFGKVYFPRLVVPLSNIIAHSIRMLVVLLLFFIVYLFYYFNTAFIAPSPYILLLPFLLILTAFFSFGAGLIISVLTARYRDLDYTLQFLLRLFMFTTPVVYPASIVPQEYQFLYWLNPLTAFIETFRAAFFSHNPIPFNYLLISVLLTIVIVCVGLMLFKKQELKIMDII